MLFFFFFQAEDGIRDLVRSRGLGDVYKRQGVLILAGFLGQRFAMERPLSLSATLVFEQSYYGAVSYTHLTLPTSDLV